MSDNGNPLPHSLPVRYSGAPPAPIPDSFKTAFNQIREMMSESLYAHSHRLKQLSALLEKLTDMAIPETGFDEQGAISVFDEINELYEVYVKELSACPLIEQIKEFQELAWHALQELEVSERKSFKEKYTSLSSLAFLARGWLGEARAAAVVEASLLAREVCLGVNKIKKQSHINSMAKPRVASHSEVSAFENLSDSEA